MKLYFAPGTFSQVPHIMAEEMDLKCEFVKLNKSVIDDLKKKCRGALVPALEIEGGEVISEISVIMQYLADKAPGNELIPQSGGRRYSVLEWISYIKTSVQSPMTILANPSLSDQARELYRKRLNGALARCHSALKKHPYLTGGLVSAADIYLYVALKKLKSKGAVFTRLNELNRFYKDIESRPATKKSLIAEGIGA